MKNNNILSCMSWCGIQIDYFDRYLEMASNLNRNVGKKSINMIYLFDKSLAKIILKKELVF